MSREEVYKTVMVASRSQGKSDVPNGALMGGGMRYAKRDGEEEASVASEERETTAGVVRKVAMDLQTEVVGEGIKRDRDVDTRQDGGKKHDIARFQSEVVGRGGPRLLSQRVGECSRALLMMACCVIELIA